jgi:hypothetical protein
VGRQGITTTRHALMEKTAVQSMVLQGRCCASVKIRKHWEERRGLPETEKKDMGAAADKSGINRLRI